MVAFQKRCQRCHELENFSMLSGKRKKSTQQYVGKIGLNSLEQINKFDKEKIAACAGQDSKRVGVGIISVLGKVFSPIVRAVFEKIGKSKNKVQKWSKMAKG